MMSWENEVEREEAYYEARNNVFVEILLLVFFILPIGLFRHHVLGLICYPDSIQPFMKAVAAYQRQRSAFYKTYQTKSL